MAAQARPLSLAIRTARRDRGLTQLELANQVGVSQGTISFWENGAEAPTVEHIITLAAALPEIIESLPARERALLQRLLQLERELFNGRCACPGCSCSPEKAQPQPTTNSQRRKIETMKIAITGKGGVGKTTIAGTLARVLAQNGQAVMALDADSNPNLSYSLGISREQAAQVPAVPPGLTEWREDKTGQAYVHLRQPVSQFIADYGIAAPGGVRLLVMGEVHQASAGCRCEAHAVARGITGHLLAEADVVVLDMEAGLEHLGRGTTEHVDILLIVLEPYYRALEAASRIRDLAVQLEIPHIVVAANRVRTEAEQAAITQYCRQHTLDLIATIPFDETILAAEQQGLSPLDYDVSSPAMQAITDLAQVLRSRLG